MCVNKKIPGQLHHVKHKKAGQHELPFQQIRLFRFFHNDCVQVVSVTQNV